ncbi:MAG: hypothetical protein ACTSR8_12295 [Promethearchaeota archaeon]
MIQNLIIIQDGNCLLLQHFGECHAIKADKFLVGGYISALQTLSQEIAHSIIKSINFEDGTFHFYIDPLEPNLTYMLITDREDDIEDIRFKLKRIAKLFIEQYSKILANFNGNIKPFEEFGNLLIEMKIEKKIVELILNALIVPIVQYQVEFWKFL